MVHTQHTQSDNLAYFFITIAQIIFPSSYIYPNEHNFHPIQTNLIKGITFILASTLISIYKQVGLENTIRDNFKMFLVRNGIVIVHSTCMTIIQFMLSISVIHTINSFGSLFVFVWDYLLNGISINWKQFFGIVLGTIGVLLAGNGDQIYSLIDDNFINESSFLNFYKLTTNQKAYTALAFILVNIIWAYSATLIKQMKMDDACQINFHLGLLFVLTSGLSYPIIQTPKPMSEYPWAFLLCGVPQCIAQQLFIMGLQMVKDTGVATLFLFVSVITGYTYSTLRYHQSINPICVLGSICIIIGLLIVVRCRYRPDK